MFVFASVFTLGELRAAWVCSKYEVDVFVVRDNINYFCVFSTSVRYANWKEKQRVEAALVCSCELGRDLAYVRLGEDAEDGASREKMDTVLGLLGRRDFQKWIPRLGLHGENQFAMSTSTVEMWGKAKDKEATLA